MSPLLMSAPDIVADLLAVVARLNDDEAAIVTLGAWAIRGCEAPEVARDASQARASLDIFCGSARTAELADALYLARRILAGRTAYAPWSIGTDARDNVAEARPEFADAMAYSAAEMVRTSARSDVALRCMKAAVSGMLAARPR